MTSKDRVMAPLVCNFHAIPGAGAVLGPRCEEARRALAAMDFAQQLVALCDTRALHGQLFAGLAPSHCPDAAGTYRGTVGSSIETAARAVFLARRRPGLRLRDMCLPADQVADAMAALAADMRASWQAAGIGGGAFQDQAYTSLAGLTARFFAIHPFMDGNGHIWRLVLPVLGRRWGLDMRPEWTVHNRPYGPEFSLALQWYGDHPSLMSDHLRRWLHPVRDDKGRKD